ncbi:multidrug and toxin extrusion protein 1-like isoform X2 [Scyliorhinus torazame]
MENSKKPNSENVAQTPGSCGNRFLREIRRLKPINFWQEAKRISKLAGQVFLTQLMIFLINFVSSAFCGHLGKVELDAVSLATAVLTLSATSIYVGLSTACDTLISQTFGSKNLKRIGVILQRGILILSITCFPCWALFINIEHILLACKQSPAVAKLTQLYMKIYIPGLPAAFMYDLEIRYLQNQGITMPQIVTGFIANILNAVINYLFLFVLTLGVQGSAAANVISQYCQAILLFGYIRWKKLHVNTWAGWSTDCLQEWGNFLRLAIPSLCMLCIECWTYQIGTLLVGLISEVQLGAHFILYQTLTVAYVVPLGFSVAVSVHVGNALGARNPEQAVNSAKVAMCCIGFFSLVNSILLGTLKDVLGYIFTNDNEIVQLVAEIIPICIVAHLFDGMAGVCGGVLRGAGKQKLGAIGNLVGYYLIGCPIGISLMFAAKLGAFGFWSGILICVIVQVAFFQTVIYRINWKETANQAQVNAGMVSDKMDITNSSSGGQSKDIATEEDAEHSAMVLMPNVCELEQRLNSDGVTDESSIVDAGVITVGEILSTKQLIIRRGLAFLSGPLILAIGLAIHFSLEKDP